MVRPKTKGNDKFEKSATSFKNSTADLEADFPNKSKNRRKSTFHECIVNVPPVTNPTPMSASDKYKIK